MRTASVICRICLPLILIGGVEWDSRTAGQEPSRPGEGVAADKRAGGNPPESAELPPAWFVGARDRTTGIADTERDAYYAVLARAAKVSQRRLGEVARKVSAQSEAEFHADPRNRGRRFSQFAQIIQHPDQFRGKPVTLHGYLQGLDTMEAGENDEGLQTLHQMYLFTADSLQSPWVVVCTEIPDNLPRPGKGSPTNDVTVTGYFFKLWSYEAERGPWGAPLILAGRLEWNPPPMPLSARWEFKAALAGGFSLALLGIAVIVARQRRNDRRLRAALAARMDTASGGSFDPISRLEQEQ